MSDEKKYHCTRCGENFKSGDWYRCFGDLSQKHVIEKKHYYSEFDRLCINWKTDRTVIDPTGQGQAIKIPGADASFVGGEYASTDPEEQEALDKVGHLLSYEVWLDKRTKPEMKVAHQKAVIEEKNALIETLQKQLAEKKHANQAGSR